MCSRISRLLIACLVLALVSAGCGFGGNPTATPTLVPTTTPTPLPTVTPTLTPTATPALQEIRQWAISATASSFYGNPSWAPSQATGAPNTAGCGDRTTAWASQGANTVEWIELTYALPVIPKLVNIFQTYNPTSVSKVELRDVAGTYHEVYNAAPQAAATCPLWLSVQVQGADYYAVAVKITLDQSVIAKWNEIDAVELVGMTEVIATPTP